MKLLNSYISEVLYPVYNLPNEHFKSVFVLVNVFLEVCDVVWIVGGKHFESVNAKPGHYVIVPRDDCGSSPAPIYASDLPEVLSFNQKINIIMLLPILVDNIDYTFPLNQKEHFLRHISLSYNFLLWSDKESTHFANNVGKELLGVIEVLVEGASLDLGFDVF